MIARFRIHISDNIYFLTKSKLLAFHFTETLFHKCVRCTSCLKSVELLLPDLLEILLIPSNDFCLPNFFFFFFKQTFCFLYQELYKFFSHIFGFESILKEDECTHAQKRLAHLRTLYKVKTGFFKSAPPAYICRIQLGSAPKGSEAHTYVYQVTFDILYINISQNPMK